MREGGDMVVAPLEDTFEAKSEYSSRTRDPEAMEREGEREVG